MKEQSELFKLTPIEKYDGVYFKRDDLYKPFDDIKELGGGKVRQMQLLIDSLMNQGNWLYNGIITNSSINSPQAIIVAKIAQEYKIPCIIGVGVKKDSLEQSIEKHKTLKISKQLGAEIKTLAGIGFPKVLENKCQIIADELNYLNVGFGINTNLDSKINTYSVIRGISSQVQNLPDYIDNLIIPCGSGISMAGIIYGLKLYKKKVKRIIGIQISGYSRQDKINSILSQFNIKPNYEFLIDTTYKYNVKVNQKVTDGFDLSVIYESKAFEYFQKNKLEMNIKDEELTMFWCIGCNNFLFEDDIEPLKVNKKVSKKKVEKEGFKISLEDFKRLVNPCSEVMIKDHCKAECCKDSYMKLNQPLIVVLKEEEKKLQELSNDYKFKIDSKLNLLRTIDKGCPFVDSQTNFCNLHNTDKKPFGCSIMPISITGKVIGTQNYFPKMKCQSKEFLGVQKVPFYIGFKQSLIALFGKDETDRIVLEIEKGSNEIFVSVDNTNLEKAKEVKKTIMNVTKISKH